jgi:hypothetical protein
MAEALRMYAALLERCRVIGVDAALAEAEDALLATLLKDFIDCYSWADSYHYLIGHADLRSDRALEVVADIAGRAEAAGAQDFAKVVRTHERLLRRVREVGPESAFLEVGGMDYLRGMQFHEENRPQGRA